MYNRYIPQSDGTFQRSRHPDNLPASQVQHPPVQEPVIHPAQAPHNRPPAAQRPRPRPPHRETYSDKTISGFLKQLLPKDFDAGDLLVILLLLLMSGDSQEDQNTALLTLVLYLFL